MSELETPAPGMTTPSASSGEPASAFFALFDNAPVGSLDGTLANTHALPQAPNQAAVGTGDMLWRGVHDAQLAGAPHPLSFQRRYRWLQVLHVNTYFNILTVLP